MTERSKKPEKAQKYVGEPIVGFNQMPTFFTWTPTKHKQAKVQKRDKIG
jgi:hypothetical protein